MNLPAEAIAAWFALAAWPIVLLVGLQAWRRAGAALRSRPVSPHLLGALIVVLALLWMMRAGPIQGTTVHMLGAALALFLLDAPLAVLAMFLVAVLDAAFGTSPWQLAPINALLHGLLPVLLARAWLSQVEKRLPPNFFVYVFVGVFLGTALVCLGTTLLASALVWLSTGVSAGIELLVALILAEGEAVLTGMIVTVFVVYRPQWVATFDDARYLRRRGPALDRSDR